MGTRSDYYIRYADGHITYLCSHSHDGYLFGDLIASWTRRKKRDAKSFTTAVAKMRGEMGQFYLSFPWPWRRDPSITDLSYIYDEATQMVYTYDINNSRALDLKDDKYDDKAVAVLTDLPAPNLEPTEIDDICLIQETVVSVGYYCPE